MSYVEFDATNPAAFQNFVSKRQKRKRLITGLILVGVAIVVIYYIHKNPVVQDEEIG